jgi:hypothetical protein
MGQHPYCPPPNAQHVCPLGHSEAPPGQTTFDDFRVPSLATTGTTERFNAIVFFPLGHSEAPPGQTTFEDFAFDIAATLATIGTVDPCMLQVP